MLGLKIYRILTFILLPFALFLILNITGSLVISLGNPLMLLSNFILACLPIYIFTSSYFLLFGVFKAKKCKSSLKDWIKINSYISIIFSLLMIMGSVAILLALNNQAMQKELMDKIATQQMSGMPNQMPIAQILQLLKTSVSIMLPFSIILLVHIAFTFRTLKLYRHLFDEA
ncbi:MAG: hypothetical protein H7068_09770 [Pedobacter sp.]|nr:hypothetical protein [Chitinophagaceae bacterium]